MKLTTDAQVKTVINRYPQAIRTKINFLRDLILEAATDSQDIDSLEETLKWGEPAYLTKLGSSIRIAWHKVTPDQYGIYFHCQTKLVDTFRQIYTDTFQFEGNRAILFNVNDTVPVQELKHCIALALHYHRLKHLPLLGV